ncbi:hypothetical protein [Serratia marcescens]|uniref:hypothetical protein n=1 Tax=Serratia marcescens TaxID=615 RepID=UPI00066E7806|nr:hypothetical protein [Serratia marcescens]
MAEIAKLAIRLQQISGCAAVTSSGETIMHHTFVDTILSALHDVTAELLANRKVQPVLYASEETLAYAKEGEKSLVTWSEQMGDAVIPLYTAPQAPAVPEEMKRDPDADVFDPGFMNGWNACRAAMLAQPVSSGYKLVPVDCLTTASRLIDLCRTYAILSDGGNYKERTINECENTMEVIDGLLAAAPEGGK